MTKHDTPTHPTHHVYVIKGKDDKAFWTRIGSAWNHTDGKGLNIKLTFIPLDGRIVIRTTADRPNKDIAR